MSKTAIETSDLVKRYPSRHDRRTIGGSFDNFRGFFARRRSFVQALNGVNLKVSRGEVFGLLGPNGAGKTTLIKILCTLVLPDGGEAYINGLDVVKENSEVLRNVQAVLSEARGFDWRLNARENLEFYAALYGLPRDFTRRRIDELLDFMGLTDRAKDMYQQFSTGMARKLQLCRALLLDTPVLLFDEPTAGLDPPSAIDFRSLLRDKLARSEDRTILITTHNMWEAQSTCDRVAIIDRGKIIACDSPENLRRYVNPEESYTLTFEKLEASEDMKGFQSEVRALKGFRDSELDLGPPTRLTVRVDKDFELSGLLGLIVRYGFTVKNMESYEPSLEEAFIALVKKEKGG